MSSEREATRAAFLASAGLAAAVREPLAGDASTRRYERLYPPSGPSLIFMDQPPALESAPCPPEATAAERIAAGYNASARLAAGRVEAFIACASYLRGCGLSAPQVVAADPAQGLAVLEDLGDGLYARVIEAGGSEAALYAAAIDALVQLHAHAPPPQVLAVGEITWPLLVYDDLALKTGAAVFLEWLPRLASQMTFGEEAQAGWEALWAPIRRRGEAGASVFCHRDYHAENLIWLPDRAGPQRVGLIDFQDALRAHPAWDLSMLLHDARRQIDPARETDCLARYLAARPDVDREAFLADFHALGALNIVRILGVFARLVVRDSKPRYLGFMPRMWTYLDRCLSTPGLEGLNGWFARHAPAGARG